MIFLSILAKTYALSLAGLHPWLAAALWLAGAVADFRVIGKSGNGLRRLLVLQAAALVLGWAAAGSCDYAAMRWKDGIPAFATLLAWILRLTGLQVGSQDGLVVFTTMAGPLEFAASIDGMALKVPAVFFTLCAVWLLWAEVPLREVARRLGTIAGILIVVALVRMAAVILIANGLFDFVGYESEELPWRPFMDEAAGVWAFLPFLLAAGVLLGRQMPPPVAEKGKWPAAISKPVCWGGVALMLVLGLIIYWKPSGTLKQGKLVISSHHSQWSRSDRPYDRDWYGADSGYNYACMKRLFERFYPVADATGPLTAADLDGASMLVVYDPDRRFGKEEIELVHEFVRSGGGLFVIGDHTNVFGSTSHINELCSPFGFRFRDDVGFDLDEDFHQVMDPPVPRNGFWHGMSFFKLRGPTSIEPTSLWTREVYEVGHSKSVRAIYSVNNFYPPPHDDPKMRTGTFCVATTSRYGSGRVAAWADSTVFSNFEIFYPGKYEYLLNTMHWLNHRDGVLQGIGRRMAPLVLIGLLGFFLLRRREPGVWLVTLAMAVASLAAARFACGWLEERSAAFPKPIQPSEWLFFNAHATDKGHHLRDFLTEVPYDQRYEVFIQWVLRTGAFTGFDLLDWDIHNELHQHFRSSGKAATAAALIVRTPADLPQVGELAAMNPPSAKEPLLLMFASTISAEQAVAEIKRSGLIGESALAGVATAWPAGEVVIEDGGRKVLIVAGAERFSDQAMGLSEKVTPGAAQRALFDKAFGVIDRLFGHGGGERK